MRLPGVGFPATVGGFSNRVWNSFRLGRVESCVIPVLEVSAKKVASMNGSQIEAGRRMGCARFMDYVEKPA